MSANGGWRRTIENNGRIETRDVALGVGDALRDELRGTVKRTSWAYIIYFDY